MTNAAMTDLDFDLFAAERAGIELERSQRLAFGGGGVSFEFRVILAPYFRLNWH